MSDSDTPQTVQGPSELFTLVQDQDATVTVLSCEQLPDPKFFAALVQTEAGNFAGTIEIPEMKPGDKVMLSKLEGESRIPVGTLAS